MKKIHSYKSSASVSNLAIKTTDYLDGFQYETLTPSTNSYPILKFVPTAEGYFNFENNKYIYNYVDHLGNVRLSYFNNGSSIEVLEENNYYPFGLKHEGYNALAGNPAYQYKYNGKELQETGMYDYGARFYMPDIGRWGVVDPLAEKMTRHSPYNYAFSNPINFMDPDGREGKGWIHQMFEDGTQKVTYRSDINTEQEAIDAGYINVYGVSQTGEITNTSDDSVAYSLNADGTVTDAAGETTKGYLTTSSGINIQAKDAFDLTRFLSHLGNQGGDFYANLGGAAPIEPYSNPFFRGDIDKIVNVDGYFGGMVNSLSRGTDWKDLMAYRVDIMALGDLAFSAIGGARAERVKDDTIVNVQFRVGYKYDPNLGYVTSRDTAVSMQIPKMPNTNKRYDYLGNSDIRKKVDSISKLVK